MAGSSRNMSVGDDLDSTILRHQYHQYMSGLQQETTQVTPLHMDFLCLKRPSSKAPPSRLSKKMNFDQEATSVSASASQMDEERKLAAKDAELADLRQQLVRARMRQSELETEVGRLDEAMRSADERRRAAEARQAAEADELRAEAERQRRRGAELSREALRQRQAADELRLAAGEMKLAHQQRLTAADRLLDEERQGRQVEVEELRLRLERAQLEANRQRLDADEVRERLLDAERRADEAAAATGATGADLRATVEHQRQVILQMENALFAQRAAASQSQEARLARIPQLEKEVARLQTINQLHRETAANELLLQEQIRTLQTQLSRANERCAALAGLETALDAARTEAERWRSEAAQLWGSTTVDAAQMRHHVEEMRRKELALTSDAGQLQLDLKAAQRTEAALREQLAAGAAEAAGRHLVDERLRKLERKLAVVQRDRDHYRQVNEMYEKEMTMVGGFGAAAGPGGGGGGETSEGRVQELETLLDEYRRLVAADGDGRPADVEPQVRGLQQQVQALTEQLEQARSQVPNESDTTKVLHFTANPLDECRRLRSERIAALENENAALLERVRLMSAGHSADLTLLVGEKLDEGRTSAEFQALEERLRAAQLKEQRTEEAMRKYCSEFRRGVFHLFGYQVDFDDSGNFKVISVYSDSNNDHLAFKYVNEGLMIMESAYLHCVDDLVQVHVHRQGSIPAFLAALTIELFSRQSINQSSSSMAASSFALAPS